MASSNMDLEILVVGSSTQDIFLKARNFSGSCLPLGEKLTAEEMVVTTGGGASNVAVGLSRQGIKTGIITLTGNDEGGKNIKEEFKKENVYDLLSLKTDGATATSFIFVSKEGERVIIQHNGVSQDLDIEREKEILEPIKTKWIYIIDNLGKKSETNFKLLINWAEERNISVAFTPNKKMIEEKDRWIEMLKNVDLLILNSLEGGMILENRTEKNEAEMSKELSQMTKGVVVLTAGKKGSWCVQKENLQEVYFEPTPDDQIVDRTGAGDAYSSGFLSEYIRSGNIKKAMEFGTQNATSVVQYFGGKKGLLKA